MAMKTAILGASGYTGAELLRLSFAHPEIEIHALSAENHADKNIKDVFPHLGTAELPKLQKIDAIDFLNLQTVFCCLPHGTTQHHIAKLYQNYPHLKIIDLSADFRLDNIQNYHKWYGQAHACPDLQKQAVYGLSEIYRADIRESRLIANPGCYTTAAQLPLIPLLKQKLIADNDIIIDAKSGISGAGRAAKQAMLYTETAQSFMAYGLDGHRHRAEIEEQFEIASGKSVGFHFLPHLVPMKRGIFATLHCLLPKGEKQAEAVKNIRAYLTDYYDDCPFIHILGAEEAAPKTADVVGSNQCKIALYPSEIEGRIVILSVIDNLMKGASGQAIQNFNILYDLDETTGLQAFPLFP